MNQDPFEQLTYARFAALLKTRFLVRADAGQQIELKLEEAKQLPSRGAQSPEGTAMKNECYCLLFNGPLSSLLPQKIYNFEHPELGAFSLFLVPVGRTNEAVQYEVVINRLTER